MTPTDPTPVRARAVVWRYLCGVDLAPKEGRSDAGAADLDEVGRSALLFPFDPRTHLTAASNKEPTMTARNSALATETIAAIAAKVAPIVHLHPQEQFLPSSVGWYLSQVKLYKGSTLVQQAGTVTAEMIGALNTPGNPDDYNLVVDDSGNDPLGVHRLSQAVLDVYAGQPLVGGVSSAECYYHCVASTPDGPFFLTFYFFYACNGGVGRNVTPPVEPGPMGTNWGFYGHEGDWEAVTFAFKRGSDDQHIRPLYVAREAHGDPDWQWLDSTEIPISSLQPIQVWSSWHSHSSRAAAGTYPLGSLFTNPGIDYAGDGPTWTTSASLVNLDAASPPAWVAYTGLWGTARVINFFPNAGPPLIDSGPKGPNDKPTWTGPPSGLNGLVFSPPQQISGQGTDVPALAAFGQYLYTVYPDADGSKQFWQSRTLDGINWTDTQKIDGQSGGTPALAVFGDYLYLIYTDSDSAQLWQTRTLDGLNWTDTQKIEGQSTSVPALAMYGDYLYMVYTDSNSSQLWQSRTKDGFNWTDTQTIDGQFTSIPALAVFNGALRMVYTDSNSSQLWQSQTVDGLNWTKAQIIPGQYTSIPAVAVFDDWLYMVYSDAKNSQLWVTRSNDGTTWVDTQQIQGQGTNVPAVAVLGGLLVTVYSDSNSSQLWESYLDEPHSDPGP